MTLEQGMAAVISVLAVCVLKLFLSLDKIRTDCESDRKSLWQHIRVLEGRSCGIPECELRKPVKLPDPKTTVPRPEPA